MRLKDVLALPKSIDSLDLLRDFLKQPLTYDEYMAAFLHYCDILLKQNFIDHLISDIHEVIEKYPIDSFDPIMDHVYHVLIDAYITKGHLPNAYETIKKRKDVLPYNHTYKVLTQEYNCLKQENKVTESYFIEILEIPMPEDVYTYFVSEYVTMLIDRQSFEQAKSILERAQIRINEPLLELKLPILLGLSEYPMILDILEKQQGKMTPLTLYYKMAAYIGLKNHQKAINLEVDNELIMESDINFQLKFYELLLGMYQSLKNMLSIKIYETKINKLKSSQKKKSKVKDDDKESEIKIETTYVPKSNSLKSDTKSYEYTIMLWSKISTLPLDQPLRELYRHMGLWSQSYTPFSVFLVYFKHEKTLFFYKKERLYDKKIKPNQLEHTMIEYMMEHDVEGYFDQKHFKLRKDILTDETYQNVHHIYGYKNDDIIMLTYYVDVDKEYGSEDFILQAMFHSMHQLSRFKLTLTQQSRDQMMYQFLLKLNHLTFRVYYDGMCQYSASALSKFELRQETMLQDFIDRIHSKDQVQYQEHMRLLSNYALTQHEITFNMDDVDYKEVSFVSMIADQPVIISFYEDMTALEHHQQTQYITAHQDIMTGFKNITGFLHDFKHIIERKITFLYIALSKDVTYLYGQKSYSTYFKEFAHLTHKLCEADGIYVMDPQHLMVILPYNDIRAVTKTIRQYMDKVLSWIPKSIPQEPFLPYIGALRYPVVTTEQKPDVILSYLDIALNHAYHMPYPFMHDFQFADYEADQKEQYILDQIHEAINHHQFAIGFHQIIDQIQNKVFMYESFAYIPHLDIDEKDIKRIAKKRKRIYEFDMAHIKRVANMLKTMFDTSEKYIKILIPIDKETLTHHKALETISSILSSHHIPPNIMSFNVEGDFKASMYAVLFDDLKNMGIEIHVSSLKTALYYPAQALHFDVKYPDAKMISYLKMIQTFCIENNMVFIIRNVSQKESKQQLMKENLRMIEGPIYKRLTEEALFTKVQQK